MTMAVGKSRFGFEQWRQAQQLEGEAVRKRGGLEGGGGRLSVGFERRG